MTDRTKPKQSAMLECFLKMTPEQMEYVYQFAKHKVPGVDIAYRAAKNIYKFKFNS